MSNQSGTITITNFGGPLTRRNTGDIDSGLAKYSTSWGYDPYSKPGNLTWLEQPVSILSNVLMMTMKERMETGYNYAYGIANGNTLYKIAINSINNPNFDTPSVLATLPADNYTGGGGMTFYGTTEKIFFGGDQNVTKVNFDGSSASIIGVMSAAGNAPRPFANFLGKTYFGNGNNIGEIDSTENIITATKLTPGLPSGLFVTDLDLSTDGNYLQIIASRANPLNALGGGTAGDIGSFGAVDAFKFYWNGIDTSYTSFENHSGMVLSANLVHGNESHIFGYDSSGTGIFSDAEKVASLPDTTNPQANAVISTGNVAGFVAPEYETATGRFRASYYHYGRYDTETPKGLFRLLRQNAPVKEDILSVPACIKTTNKMHVPQQFGFANNLAGAEKIYYSTLEAPSVVGSSIATLWRFSAVPTGTGSIVAGVYETQTELFSKRVTAAEVRLYTDPLVANNSFTIDLIGAGGSVLSGGSQTFTVGTNANAGDEMVNYNPATKPTHALGARITNSSILGTVNWTATKLEIDVNPRGK